MGNRHAYFLIVLTVNLRRLKVQIRFERRGRLLEQPVQKFFLIRREIRAIITFPIQVVSNRGVHANQVDIRDLRRHAHVD